MKPYQRVRWIKKGITLYSHRGEDRYLAKRYGEGRFFRNLEDAELFVQLLFKKRKKNVKQLNEL